MRVTIWDMDWYSKHSFIPNHIAQKLSSYHKQQGDIINFVEEEHHLSFDYDLMYILRNRSSTPMPPRQYINKLNVKLIGPEFKYYDNNYSTPMVVDMVRPDYSLYPEAERNSFVNAHMLQLLHGRTPIPKRQDFQNYGIKHHQVTLVVDNQLWRVETNILKELLNELKQYKNLAFLHPISLNRLMEDETLYNLFLELDLSNRGNLRFRNDYGSDYESVIKVIDFYLKLREKKQKLSIKPIPVKAIILNHWEDKKFYLEDLKRCLKIVDYAKEQKVHVILKTPSQRLESPYWYLFDSLEVWTSYYREMSYIESMVSSRAITTKERWYEILNDSEKRSTPRSQFIAQLLVLDYEFFAAHGVRQWGENRLDPSFIDMDKIRKSFFGKNTDTIVDRLQEEME